MDFSLIPHKEQDLAKSARSNLYNRIDAKNDYRNVIVILSLEVNRQNQILLESSTFCRN